MYRNHASPATAWSSRRARATGRRAARTAGKKPPTTPMINAAFILWINNSGVTAKLITTWLKLGPSDDGRAMPDLVFLLIRECLLEHVFGGCADDLIGQF